MSKLVKDNTIRYMKEKLASKPDLLNTILPDGFDIGCRRQTFAYGYLEAIMDPKTTVFTKQPSHFTETGIVDSDGVEHEVDLVIVATGYDQSHRPQYPKKVNGTPVQDLWTSQTSPPSYMATMLRGMPNYFNPAGAYGQLYYVSTVPLVTLILFALVLEKASAIARLKGWKLTAL